MAIYSITTESLRTIPDANLTTVLHLRTGANKPAKLQKLSLSCFGVTAADKPALVYLRFSSNNGTFTGTLTEAPFDEHNATAAETTGHVLATTEPTTPGNRIEAWGLHGQGGLIDVEYPAGREPIIKVSSAINLEITIATGTLYDVCASMRWEE